MPDIVTSNQFFGLPQRPDPSYFLEGMKLRQDQQSTQQTNAFNQRKMELLEEANVRNQNRDIRAEAKDTREAAEHEQKMTEKDIEQIYEHGAKFIQSYDENDPNATETFANAGIAHLEAIHPTMKKAGKMGEAAMASVVALIKKAKDVTIIPQGTPERMAAEASFRKGIIGIRETWMGAKPQKESANSPEKREFEAYKQSLKNQGQALKDKDKQKDQTGKALRDRNAAKKRQADAAQAKLKLGQASVMTEALRAVVAMSGSAELQSVPPGEKIPPELKKEALQLLQEVIDNNQQEINYYEETFNLKDVGNLKTGANKEEPSEGDDYYFEGGTIVANPTKKK